MKITFITLFPEIFPAFLNFSILKRAQDKGLIEFNIINLRDFGEGNHKTVDDKPYGGGVGMILKPEVLTSALKSIFDPDKIYQTGKLKIKQSLPIGKNLKFKIVLMSAAGNSFKQRQAKELTKLDHLIIICGHYEGVDQRFIDKYVSEEISIGDYVLTGGELPSLVIADSVARLIPGVLEKPEATEEESFSGSSLLNPSSSLLLEYPQYTRPEEFEGIKVPEILLSGNHQEIKKWRLAKSQEKTKKLRPEGI